MGRDDEARRKDARERDLEDLLVRRRRRQRRAGRGSRKGPRRTALLGSAFLLALVAGAAIIGAAAAPQLIASSCSLSSLKPISLGANSFVTASDGSFLGVIPAKKNRQRLSLREMSPWLPKATVAIEDRRFWQHGALDYVGIARAAIRDVSAGKPLQGASTLTQQLARNLYIGHPRDTLSRKLKEACLAIKLAQHWSKQRILASYLNLVYYGNQAYGVEAAAQTYFSKPAGQLGVLQSALLAGLPQAPSVYDPLHDPAAARARRNEVLTAMRDAGYLKPSAWAWAVRQPLGLHPGSLYKTIRQPYFFGYVTQQLVAHYGSTLVESGGLRVKTTIVPRLQRLAERSLHDVLRSRRDPAGALVSIDTATGHVLAMAVDVPSGQHLVFNLATQGHRQPGSSFKPFTLAAALERGISLYSSYSGPPAMTIPDPACSNGINQPWLVHNYADESAGTMSLLDATAFSVNTIYAQVVAQIGPQSVVAMAHRLGIRSPLKPVCSITLGSQAVSPLEMASAYATLAAGGVRHDPTAVASVRTAGGRWLPYPVGKPRRALSPNVAAQVDYALQGVIQHGTGTGANIGRPAGGKTGTAENYVDAWFCGFVPQRATCVWVGYPHKEVPLLGVEGYGAVFGGSLPATIWREFMSGAVASLPVKDFPQPQISTPGYWTYSSSSTTTTTATTTTSTTTTATTG